MQINRKNIINHGLFVRIFDNKCSPFQIIENYTLVRRKMQAKTFLKKVKGQKKKEDRL